MASKRPPLPPLEALKVLAVFLDPTQDAFDRYRALNHRGVSDEVLSDFVRTLDSQSRARALTLCDRPEVLEVWGCLGTEADRAAVAGNPSTSDDSLLALAFDASDVVRVKLALNPAAGIDVVATLLGDPSPAVQTALGQGFELERKAHDVSPRDDAAGDDESLRYLYDLVSAAQELDLIDEHISCEAAEKYEAIFGLIDDSVSPSDVDCDGTANDEDPILTLAQIVGLLRDKLDAEITEQSSDGAVTFLARPPQASDPQP